MLTRVIGNPRQAYQPTQITYTTGTFDLPEYTYMPLGFFLYISGKAVVPVL